MVGVLFAACSADKLDRDEALKLIQDRKLYPNVISYAVFTADPVHARRVLDARLESSGMLTVQRGYSGDTDPRTGHTDPPIGFWLSKLIA